MIRTVLFLALACTVSHIPTAHEGRVAEEIPLLLVSIDGFRADYLEWYDAPTLWHVAHEGVRAQSMVPVFPTRTFPNHYTLITGLYPAHHGITGNTIRDPDIDQRFNLRNRDALADSRWWGGTPLWVTLEKQGIITAPLFWPGTEAAIQGTRPRHWMPYDGTMGAHERIAWVMERLRLPAAQRPRFLTLYFSDVDTQGHRHGPHSEEVKTAVHRVDGYLRALLDSLDAAKMQDEINILITSDHGMTETSRNRVVFLDDYANMDDVESYYGDPSPMIHPAKGREDILYNALQNVPHMTFYRKDDIPEVFRFRDHRRIAPIVGIADEGWRITTRRNFDKNPEIFDGGAHGYDHRLPSMHAIFIARGPAFQKGILVDSFSIIHVYALMAHILNVTPAPHDGDLREINHLLAQ